MSLVKIVAPVLFGCLLYCFTQIGLAQQTILLPWNPAGAVQGKLVYHPEPILFVHGINDNDGDCWPTAITNLLSYFAPYYLPSGATPFLGNQTTAGLRANQEHYLHTFNYGCPPGVNNSYFHDLPTFDHIEWNVMEANKNSLSFINGVTGHLDTAPGVSDTRQTLDLRIADIRAAYEITINGVTQTPLIVLVAHSMGGVLSHYYMLQSGANCGVRRLVTIATPHLGSPIANWLYSMKVVNPTANWASGFIVTTVLNDLHLCTHKDEVGFDLFTANGAVEDLMTIDVHDSAGCVLQFGNDLQDYFFTNQAPKIEYVFNTYHHPFWTGYQGFHAACKPAWTEADHGDGLVPVWSAAGKHFHDESSIWNGFPGSFPTHDIDPVIFGTWPNLDHSDAKNHSDSLLRSIDGVPHRWTGSTTNDWPWYARTYGENQSFSKYLPTSETDGSTAHTDEPGIAELKLLYEGNDNPLVIPSVNTWLVTNGIGQKKTLVATNFSGNQVIGGGNNPVRVVGTMGVKNHSPNPVGTQDMNYWIEAGNEYLPASVSLQFGVVNSGPITAASGTNDLTSAYSFVTECLVQMDTAGMPVFQYGYFEVNDLDPITSGTNNYVAAQGYNLAGLLTPQAERAFDVPVDSVTVVTILKKINAAEILSNACHGATKPTRWKNNVQEWVATDSGTITLNFFPVTTTPNAHDAWINTAFTVDSSNYNANTKTITVDPASAPSQLIVSNQVYLGCNEVFTNSYGGIVPALTANTLAGVPIDEAFLTQIRTALNGILHKYQTNTSCVACGGYDLPTALRAAGYPSSNTTWSTVVGGLILPSHITELQKVLSVLTEELHCCCSNVTITLSPSSASATDTNALPDGSSNVVYSTTITAGGTDCPHYKFTVADGSSLPPGSILTNLTDTSADITGTPTTVGSNTFVITATNTNGCSTNQLFSLAILAIPAIPGPCPACPVALATYSLTITYRQYYVPENTICEGTCSVEGPFVFGTGGYYETTYTFPLTPFSDCSWQGSADGWIPSGVLSANLWALTSRASSMQVGIFGCAFSLISLTNNSGTPCTLVGSYGATPTSCIGGDKIMSAVISAAP